MGWLPVGCWVVMGFLRDDYRVVTGWLRDGYGVIKGWLQVGYGVGYRVVLIMGSEGLKSWKSSLEVPKNSIMYIYL